MGYVPRDEALKMAPLLDAGAEVDATVRRLWETPDDARIVPIVQAKVRRGDADPSLVGRVPGQLATNETATAVKVTPSRPGCATLLCLTVILFVVVLLIASTAGV